jgi:hypothetical protein
MNRYCVLLLGLLPLTTVAEESPPPMPTPFVLNPSPQASPTPFVLNPPPVLAPSPEPVAVNLTAENLGPFLDGLMNAELTHRDIAGAVITVVKDGQILLCKGFGYSDFARRQTVVPDRTLFRPGSITKLFTGIAVMQLVEEDRSGSRYQRLSRLQDSGDFHAADHDAESAHTYRRL